MNAGYDQFSILQSRSFSNPDHDSTGAELELALIFDGGSKGNPGPGYGSYRLSINGAHQPVMELDFGNNVTNNQAEYRTMIEGLKHTLKLLRANDVSPSAVSIDVRTDSKLVVEQVNGRWKIRNEGLKPLSAEARSLLNQFGSPNLTWHPRKKSVEVLGH